ncbi:putative capsid protein [Soybean thrips-associated totivirus 2]|uniref:Putative capsid protein n=1 Tax=Soybean thrips-associated totivirus 2 TaxID=2800857 RepID=A0A7U3TJQ3_9VIRU|nr:putative capsid protein [Soybean thrips-associated totivirus 2]
MESTALNKMAGLKNPGSLCPIYSISLTKGLGSDWGLCPSTAAKMNGVCSERCDRSIHCRSIQAFNRFIVYVVNTLTPLNLTSRKVTLKDLIHKRPFKIDLTIEGIESNPGPPADRGARHGRQRNRQRHQRDISRDPSGEGRANEQPQQGPLPDDRRTAQINRTINAINRIFADDRQNVALFRIFGRLPGLRWIQNIEGEDIDLYAEMEQWGEGFGEYGTFTTGVNDWTASTRGLRVPAQPTTTVLEAAANASPEDQQFRMRLRAFTRQLPELVPDRIAERYRSVTTETAQHMCNQIIAHPHRIAQLEVVPEELRTRTLQLLAASIQQNHQEHMLDVPQYTRLEIMVMFHTGVITREEVAHVILRTLHEGISRRRTEASLERIFNIAGYDLQRSRMHNKTMHALNGNIFAKCMADIDDMPTWEDIHAFYEGEKEWFDPEMFSNLLINMHHRDPVHYSGLYEADGIYSQIMNTQNQIIAGQFVSLPNTCLYPIKLLGTYAGDQYIDHLAGVPYVGVRQQAMRGFVTVETSLASEMRDQIKATIHQRMRHLDTHLSGFKVIDLAGLLKRVDNRGFNWEVPMMKLMLLHSIISYRDNALTVPTSTYHAIDTHRNAHLFANNIPELEYNEPFLYPDAADDPTVTAPFGHGGTLSVHVSIDSVPLADQANVVFFPAALGNALNQQGMAFALFALMLARWPIGLYSLRKAVSQMENNRPVDDSVYLMLQSLVRIDGESTLRVILPRRVNSNDPTNQAEANAATDYRPCSGPEDTENLAPGQLLNVSWDKENPIDYNLAEFFTTWATAFSVVEIERFIKMLSSWFGAASTAARVQELVTMTSYITPQLITTDIPQNYEGQPANYLTELMQVAFHNGGLHDSIQVGRRVNQFRWPVAEQTNDHVIMCKPNFHAWNMIVTGLATCPLSKPDNVASKTMELGNAKAPYYEHLRHLAYTVNWSLLNSAIGMTSEAWDSVGTNTVWKGGDVYADWYYIRTGANQDFAPPPLETLVNDTFIRLYDGKMSVTTLKLANGQEIESGSFGRFILPHRFTKVVGLANGQTAVYNGYTPNTLIDVWIHHTTLMTPRFAASFPPMNTLPPSLYGYSTPAPTHENPGGHMEALINPTRTAQGPYVSANEYATLGSNAQYDVDDNTRFNERLTSTHVQCQWLSKSGNPVLASTRSAVSLPYQRQQNVRAGRAWPEVAQWTQIAGKSTTMNPSYTSTGERLFPFVNTAAGAELITSMNRRMIIPREAWLLGNRTIAQTIPVCYAGHTKSRLAGLVGFSRTKPTVAAVEEKKIEVVKVTPHKPDPDPVKQAIPTTKDVPIDKASADAIAHTKELETEQQDGKPEPSAPPAGS